MIYITLYESIKILYQQLSKNIIQFILHYLSIMDININTYLQENFIQDNKALFQ
jgi:hypothetical protein